MPHNSARRRAPPPPLATMADLAAMADPGPLPEQKLQMLLLAHLNRIPGVWLWRANTGTAHAGDRWIRFGTPGQADLLGLVSGVFLAVECKSPGGRQGADQRQFQRRIVDAGGVYLLANDFLTTMRHVLALSLCRPISLPF